MHKKVINKLLEALEEALYLEKGRLVDGLARLLKAEDKEDPRDGVGCKERNPVAT